MIIRFALAVVVLCCAGCKSGDGSRADITRKHGAMRSSSLNEWKSAQIDSEHAFDYLPARTAILWGGAVELELRQNETKLDQLQWIGKSSDGSEVGQVSSAVAIAPDGYFITAAHCIKNGRGLMVSARGDRPPIEFECRTIWNGGPISGCDLAIVYAPIGDSMPFIEWSVEANPAIGTQVLVCGAGTTSIRLAGGGIIKASRKIEFGLAPEPVVFKSDLPAIPFLHQLTIDAPLIPGDSGGPAILPNGKLLGIAVSTSSAETPKTVLLRPNPDWVSEIIAAHREWYTENAQPTARLSTDGFIFLQRQQRELAKLRQLKTSDLP